MGWLTTAGMIGGGIIGGPAGAAVGGGLAGGIEGSLEKKKINEYNQGQSEVMALSPLTNFKPQFRDNNASAFQGAAQGAATGAIMGPSLAKMDFMKLLNGAEEGAVQGAVRTPTATPTTTGNELALRKAPQSWRDMDPLASYMPESTMAGSLPSNPNILQGSGYLDPMRKLDLSKKMAEVKHMPWEEVLAKREESNLMQGMSHNSGPMGTFSPNERSLSESWLENYGRGY